MRLKNLSLDIRELMRDPCADVKQMPNKDGSGKGQMAAWKVSRL
jgi:hypothetical protein